MWDPEPELDPDDEQGRFVMAKLPQSRGEQLAAAIVAVSSYESVLVNNWDDGQYEAVLVVPPKLYDQARAECAEALDKACCDLITAAHYRGLHITVNRTDTPVEWVAAILAALKPQWVASTRADISVLDPAAS